jgi:hypothetical protein
MSLLHKIIATIRSDHARQELAPAAPVMNCLTAEAALVDRPEYEPKTEGNSTKQRRYYVKTGLYVDNEEEASASRRPATTQTIVFEKAPADLKSLFPRLSLR